MGIHLFGILYSDLSLKKMDPDLKLWILRITKLIMIMILARSPLILPGLTNIAPGLLAIVCLTPCSRFTAVVPAVPAFYVTVVVSNILVQPAAPFYTPLSVHCILISISESCSGFVITKVLKNIAILIPL